MQTTVDGSDNRLLNIVIVLIVVFIVILILYILSKWLYLQLNIQLQWMTVLFFLHLRSYLSLYVFLVIVSCLFFISIWIKFNACISFCVVFGFLNRTAVSESQQRTRNPYQCCLELEERHLFAQEFLSERLDLFQLLIACFLLAVSFQLRRIHHLRNKILQFKWRTIHLLLRELSFRIPIFRVTGFIVKRKTQVDNTIWIQKQMKSYTIGHPTHYWLLGGEDF